MVRWLRIHLPMQGTWVQSVVREPTCHKATKPARPSYRSCTPELERRTSDTTDILCATARPRHSQINKHFFKKAKKNVRANAGDTGLTPCLGRSHVSHSN